MLNFLRWILRRFVNLIADVRITGFENIPTTGAFVITTNHLGLLDAALLYYILDRTDVFVMVAEKWEKNALFRWVAKYANFVFIDRYNPDIKALRKIIGLMEQGNVLVIAPEGTRSLNAALAEGKLGAGYLAAKLNRPILPAGIAGTEDKVVGDNLKHFRRSKIRISAGKISRRVCGTSTLERITDSRFASVNSIKSSIQFQIIFLNDQAHIKSMDFSFSLGQVGLVPLERSCWAVRAAILMVDQNHFSDFMQADSQLDMF